jgi:transcriptional regulator with XRE-family HTH domain
VTAADMGIARPTILGQLRLALDLSLREFARQIGIQSSNYCNVEAHVLPRTRRDAGKV